MRLDKQDARQIVLTTPQLRKLCDQAEALRFSNGPNARFWKEVDPKGFHVVALWFVHQPIFAFWEGVDQHPQGGRVQVPTSSGVIAKDTLTFSGQNQFPMGSLEISL